MYLLEAGDKRALFGRGELAAVHGGLRVSVLVHVSQVVGCGVVLFQSNLSAAKEILKPFALTLELRVESRERARLIARKRLLRRRRRDISGGSVNWSIEGSPVEKSSRKSTVSMEELFLPFLSLFLFFAFFITLA